MTRDARVETKRREPRPDRIQNEELGNGTPFACLVLHDVTYLSMSTALGDRCGLGFRRSQCAGTASHRFIAETHS